MSTFYLSGRKKMRKEVRDKMLEEYSKLEIKAKGTCIKYRYEYNKTNVNVYFDAYDKDSYLLSLILNAEKKFYFTTLNIMNTCIRKEYLPELPDIFLKNIVVDGTLDDFYNHMEEKILNSSPIVLSYKKDGIFYPTIEKQKASCIL